MNKKEKSVIHSWLVMALVLLFIIVIIIFYINKLKEKEALEKLRLILLRRKETLEELKRNTERKVMILYNIFKSFVLAVFILICFCVHSIQHENCIQYIGNCLTFFGGLGLVTLVITFMIEENPLDLFRLRSIMKQRIHNLLFQPVQNRINDIPMIESSLDATDEILRDLDKENMDL